MKMKTFFKWVLILALIYLCYGLYTGSINWYDFINFNYLGDLGSSYSSTNTSRYDVLGK